MNCSEVHNLFTDYTDHALTEATLAIVDNHLTACPACRQELARFEQTVSLLQATPMLKPPPDLLIGIHEKMEQSFWHRFFGFWSGKDFSLSMPAAMATVSVAMFAGFLVKTTFFAELPQNKQPTQQIARTAPQANQGSLPPRTRVPNALFATTGASRRSQNQSSLHGVPFDALTAHPSPTSPHGNLLSPDMLVTVNIAEQGSKNHLLHGMLHRGWHVRGTRQGVLYVQLPATEIMQLHNLLSGHQSVMVPPEARSPHFGVGKKVLTVAVRLK